MSSNIPFTTVNGQTSFNAQLEAPSSTAFMQIFFEPQSTNDFVAIISQDPTLSGHFTYQLTTPTISGVCNNGFISCDPGTWNNCQFYEWTINSSNDVGYTSVAGTQALGSCFCNNSSCGGNFFGQFNSIANTFGAGLASFIAENTQMAITNVQASFPTLTYYGENSSQSTIASNSNPDYDYAGYQANNPSQYYGNGSSLTGAGEDLMPNQLSETGSPFNLVANNEYMNQNQVTEKTCQISHTINVTSVSPIGCPANSVPAGNLCIPNQTIMSSGWSTNGGGWEYCQVSAGILECGDQGHGLACPVNLAGVLASSPQTYGGMPCYQSQDWTWNMQLYPKNTNNTATVGWDFESSHSSAPWVTETVILGCGQECPSGYMLVNGGANGGLTCIQVSQNTNNNCSNIPSNCQIKDEQVCDQNGQNCIYIYQNYQYIAPSIQPMCYNFNGPDSSIFNFCANGSNITYQDNLANLIANYTACPGYTPYYSQSGTLDTSSDNTDWWMVKKTYTCPAGQMTIPNLTREQMVEQNETYNSASGVAVYPDQGTGYGNYTNAYSGNNFQANWSYNAPTTPCVYSCIVSIPNTPRTAVVDQGNAATNGANGTPPDAPTIDKTYLACVQDPNTKQWTCPATGSQQIIQPCVCLDQGMQSIAIMSAMVSAGSDMICSQN